jgi:hypothetical protein
VARFFANEARNPDFLAILLRPAYGGQARHDNAKSIRASIPEFLATDGTDGHKWIGFKLSGHLGFICAIRGKNGSKGRWSEGRKTRKSDFRSSGHLAF